MQQPSNAMAPDDRRHSTRRPSLLDNVSDGIRNEIVAGIGEFVGTLMFFLVPFIAVQVAKDANIGVPVVPPGIPTPVFVTQSPQNITHLYIAFAFGISLVVNNWIFFRISGGIFNPAITFALLLNKTITPQRAAVAVVAQILAAITASGLAHGLTPGGIEFATRLGHGVSVVQGLFIEAFLTFQLVLAVFLLAVEKHRATPLAPLGIGLALFIGHLAGNHYTSACMNPVRSFGPDAVVGFASYHWIYWLGPSMGAALGFLVYTLLRLLAYESANSGQDSIGAAACPYAAIDATSLVPALAPRDGSVQHPIQGGDGSHGGALPIHVISERRPAAPTVADSKAAGSSSVHYGTFHSPSSSAANKHPVVHEEHVVSKPAPTATRV